VRWQHPHRGLVPPMQFIPFAEQTGFIRQLTLWMFEEAAAQPGGAGAAGRAAGVGQPVHPRPAGLELPEKLDAMLARHRALADGFCLEITESAIMDDPQRAESTLNGWPSAATSCRSTTSAPATHRLAYLKKLPVDELKIDKSFVMAMEKDAGDAKIVRSPSTWRTTWV
jgi:EAL domain-containing protein (putative c-di-GMP-specific phosphodiesterase class I)